VHVEGVEEGGPNLEGLEVGEAGGGREGGEVAQEGLESCAAEGWVWMAGLISR